MKSHIRAIAVLALFLPAALPLAAQASGAAGSSRPANESEYYVVTVPVEKIYTYHLGWIVTYRRSGTGMGQVPLPAEWFQGSRGKGEIISLTGPGTWPYMSIYYKNGEFSHVKLAVRFNRAHPSWGTIAARTDLDQLFEGLESVQLEFN